MQFKALKRGYGLPLTMALIVAMMVGAAIASFNVPGPTQFLQLEVPNANVGFDAGLGNTFDWANAGANSIPRDCPVSATGLIQCTGTGGIFDGGEFNGATTPPTPPTLTAAAAADPTIVAASFGVDPLSVDVTACGTGDPTVYTAVGGEVNGDTLSTETFSTGSVPNKDEISNVYAISHQVPPNPAVPTPNDTNEIFAGFERVVNNGDSHVDLEFLQATLNLIPGNKPADFPCAGKFDGHRSEGDLLLSVDFTNGGTVGTQVLHKWDCGDFPPGPDKICDPVPHPPGKKISPHYEEVADTLTLSAVRQTFNGISPVGCGGWACRNADGTQNTSINTVELYEVGIDLAALGFEGCISTFLPHTRSSQSFTATLKDFEVIQFNTCVPSTSLTKTASATTIVTGGSVTYTYKEKNDGNVSLSNPHVTDDKCSPVTYVSGDTNTNNILDPAEEWTFTCTLNNITANTTNTAIGHGTWTVGNNSVDVTFCTDEENPPSGVRCDQDERAQATVTVQNPSTRLVKTASPSVVTTVVYTYAETNDGDIALSSPSVADAQCTSHGGTITKTGGDTNNNNILDPGETWLFSCTAVFNGAGPFTNVAVAHGCFTSGGSTKDVTVSGATSVCGAGSTIFADPDETDTKTVTGCTPTVTGGK